MQQTRLMERVAAMPGVAGLTAGLAAHQLQTMAASPETLDSTIEQLFDDLRAIRSLETGAAAYPNVSVHFVSRQTALMHRMKIASVLLRLEHDDKLKNADLQTVTEANARGELVFAASSGGSDGVATLDAYLAPLLGAWTPFVWAVPVTRASGTVIYALGTQVTGTASEPMEPFHLLPSVGPDSGMSAGVLSVRSAESAIAWWVRRLDGMFGIASDPAVFTDETGTYVPSKHLHAQLSLEQLFRRTASIERSHRDRDARRVLMFTTLDTLERLTNRRLLEMSTLSTAQAVLADLRKSMSADVAALLLPAAQRAVDALTALQAGFFLSNQLERNSVDFVDPDGTPQSLTLEDATAEYMRVLRNATHGHGSKWEDSRLRGDALLAHHDGSFPHDLPLLSYLYLLDLLNNPEKLRRRLWNLGAA